MAIAVADPLRVCDRHGALENVEGLAGIARGQTDEMLEWFSGQSHAAGRSQLAGQTAFWVDEGAPDDRPDLIVGEWLEAKDAQTGQQSGVDLEVRVLGRGADERDRAVLDVRQKGVLLGLVEAMDLVDEENRLLAV